MGKRRLANWDLLRSLAMFLVVVVHIAPQMQPIFGHNVGHSVSIAAIICDPIFFSLSGFFAIRESSRKNLSQYYLKKLIGVVLPVFIYAFLLYLFSMKFEKFSIVAYFAYLNRLLDNGWWFVKALIPLLVIAPFLYTMLSALSDRQVIQFTKLISVLFLLGIIGSFCFFLANKFNLSFLREVTVLFGKIIPSRITGGYLIYFILGYIVRRLSQIVSHHERQVIVAIGIVAWLFDGIFVVYRIGRVDPSFFWFYITIAIFLLFNNFNIKGKIVTKIIQWIAKRSYAIYLLQYKTIDIVTRYLFSYFYRFNESEGIQFLIWVVALLASYLLALLLASIVDVLIVVPLQKLAKSQLIIFRGHAKDSLPKQDKILSD